MKKLTFLVAALFATLAVSANVIEIADFNWIDDADTSSTQQNWTVEADGITLKFNGTILDATYNGVTYRTLRVYADNTLKVCCAEKITKIEVIGTAKKGANITATAGTVAGGDYSSATSDIYKYENGFDKPLFVVDDVNATSTVITPVKQIRVYGIRVTTVTTSYGILVNGKTYYAGTLNPTPLDQSYMEYMALGVPVKSGDYIQLYDKDNTAAWAVDLDGASTSGITKSGDKYTCSADGCYDFYIKLKYQAEQLYVEPTTSDCSTTGEDIGGSDDDDYDYDYGKAFYVYNSDGTTVGYEIAKVDSISFMKPTTDIATSDDYDYGKAFYVYKNDGTMVGYEIATVDSISFVKPTTGTASGYEWVDLGLSVKWATCNVGADTPEEYGNYYAWGETATKSDYTSSTYSANPSILPADADAATANWGGKWRMPTDAEWQELIDNCDWTWTTDYKGTGVVGYTVASKTNGNIIFLPAAGSRLGTWIVNGNGQYWSSSLYTDDPSYARHAYFDSGKQEISQSSRPAGLSVRPVVGNNNNEGVMTCAEAVTHLTATVVVEGYVAFAYNYENNGVQSAWIADDSETTAGVFLAYNCTVTQSVSKGDRVRVEGTIIQFTKTSGETIYEIANGKMTKL